MSSSTRGAHKTLRTANHQTQQRRRHITTTCSSSGTTSTTTHISQPQAPPVADIQPSAPAPAATLLHPRRNACVPVRDNDPRFSVSLYGPRARSEHASLARVDTMPNPKTYAKAMSRPDADMWDAVYEEEKRSFEIMGVYDVVPRLENRKILVNKWVLRIKWGPDGAIQKYKAHVVAQGFTQIEGVDYDETFAPVVKLAAELDWEVHQMDMKAAYLNGKLDEEIYMAPPPGFDVPEGMVLKLNKAAYGTKEGVWYKIVQRRAKTT